MAKVKVNFKGMKELQKNFRNKVKAKLPGLLKREIVSEIEKGVSPVYKQGRFKKYSKSYKSVIRGTAAFRVINGRAVPFTGKKKKQKAKIKELNKAFNASQNPAKKISPVSMRLTGGMLNSFIIRKAVRGFIIGFRSKLAVYHNEGKGNLPKRRLIPNESGERFNNNITHRVDSTLSKILKSLIK